MKQLSFLDFPFATNKKESDKIKRIWKNDFQKWSDKQAEDETSPYGK